MIGYKLFNKDARNMTDLEAESVQMVCTSPPYWGLRKYSGEQDLIWGDNHCEHKWNAGVIKHDNMRYRGESSIVGNNRNQDIHPGPETKQGFCSLCGAWKGAYGLEPSPEMYVQHTIEILREIRRVLRKDGVVFWNIGDSYASGKGSCFNPGGGNESWKSWNDRKGIYNTKRLNKSDLDHCGLKPKDLCLIPFRVAIAAQSNGWWVRSVIIWNKPNPMPESVKDRPTESHEYILMLTKSARYYWDQEAVREVYTEPLNRWGGNGVRNTSHKWVESFEQGGDNSGIGPVGKTSMLRAGAVTRPNEAGRNLRSVWAFPTQPYPEAHFAVFPEKLPELCIKAATPEVGCCNKCGAPWERITEKGLTAHDGTTKSKSDPKDKLNGSTGRLALLRQAARERGSEYVNETKTLGWQPTCKCNAGKVPSIVLDPFAGAGTTLLSAIKLGRYAYGYELSSEYCKFINTRLNNVQIKAAI